MTAAELVTNTHPVLAVHEVALYQGAELPEFLRDLSSGDLRALLVECNTVMGACWQEAARRRTEARWNGQTVDVEDIPEPQHPEPEAPAVDEVVIRNGANQVVQTLTLPAEPQHANEPPPASPVESTTLIPVQGVVDVPVDTGPAERLGGPAHAVAEGQHASVPSVAELAHAEGVNIAPDAVTTGAIGPVAVEATEAGLPKRLRPSPRPRPKPRDTDSTG